MNKITTTMQCIVGFYSSHKAKNSVFLAINKIKIFLQCTVCIFQCSVTEINNDMDCGCLTKSKAQVSKNFNQ